ncbi:unnamed protein product [Brassica rapa]|uniref:Uncharacterized protein n=2 Tax=Brassica TaxID=3705 RepID=A0A8D9G8A7_BRACM|nr:unnamed protein product [Brassica napus]CAG7871756.1 unnamed protein product [Brassica rapa]
MEIFERVKIRPRGFKIEKEKDMEKKEGIGVVSGKAIFGPPLDQYWQKKLEGEAAAKEAIEKSSD